MRKFQEQKSHLKINYHLKMLNLSLTSDEIKVIINSMKSGKAVRPYSIPIFLLKIFYEHTAIPLSEIINNSFSSGVFPDMMKLAKAMKGLTWGCVQL